jgi:glucokinase
MEASVGIDLGATKANIGVLDGSGTIVARTRVDIRDRKTESGETLRLICGEVDRLLAATGLSPAAVGFIGMGVPGTVDSTREKVVYAPNLFWQDVDTGEVFQRHLGKRAVLVQDTRAAAFAEYLLGAGAGERVVVCITLGTGIGAGIVIDGRMFGGGFNSAGELGHVIVEENGGPCSCGQAGCLEVYSSGTGISRAAQGMNAEGVFARAAAGEEWARRIIDSAVRHLGMGIVNIVNLLSPNVVILSGGMCRQEELLIAPVRQYVLRRAHPVAARALRIEKARLGEDAPMVGAALLYRGIDP